MATLTLRSLHPDITVNIGRELANYLRAGDIVSLEGDLGSGKTTLVKGVYQGMGGMQPEVVRSPTFTLINEYSARLPLYHIDFYRLKDSSELAELGLEEYFYGDGVSLVEWGDRFPQILGSDYLSVKMRWEEENIRQIIFYGTNPRFQPIFEGLKIIEK